MLPPWNDFKLALRTLRRTPATSVLAVVVLALGIGTNSAMLSLVNTLVLRPLPVHEPDRLTGVLQRDSETNNYTSVSYPNLVDLRESARAFESITGHSMGMVGIGEGSSTRRSFVSVVASNYFETFGVQPVVGRFFLPEEETPGSRIPVTVLGYRQWQRMGGSEDVLGEQIRVNGELLTVVGVAPRNFAGTSVLLAPEMFVPLGLQEKMVNDFMDDGRRGLEDRANGQLFLVGRLGDGVARDAANTDLARLSAALEAEYPGINEHQVFEAHELSRVSISTSPSTDDGVAALSTLLMAMALVVLLVAGLNLATVQGARMIARRHELAVRVAVGSGRYRLVRQLIAECLVLALGGAALGLVIAWIIPRALAASIGRLMPFELMLSGELDWRVILGTLGFSLVATLFVGLMPALRASRDDLTDDLKEGVKDTGDRKRFGVFSRNDLPVVFELALSLVLLVSAGLFVRAALQSADLEPGFSLDQSVLLEIDPSLIGYEEDRGRDVATRLQHRLSEMPRVGDVAVAATVPFGMVSLGKRVVDLAAPEPEADELPGVSARYNIVTGEYFSVLDIPLIQGRTFRPQEAGEVVVVDQLLAERLWPGETAVGRRVRFANDEDDEVGAEVIGVVGTVRESVFDRDDRPHVYEPFHQAYSANMHLHLQVSGAANDPQLLQSIRSAVGEVDEALPLLMAVSLQEHLSDGFEVWALRTGGRLFGLFAAMTLLLALAGVYGVRAYSVQRRQREIGLRMALGASARNTIELIMKDGFKVIAIGAVIGLALSAGVAKLLESFLFEVDSWDPTVFGASVVLLALVAMVACLLPARRASRLDPLVALRAE